MSGSSYRPRTFLEMQPFLLAYGAAISCFSPLATVYQQVKLNPIICADVTWATMVQLSLAIYPMQTVLKYLQMNASTPVKQYVNPWVAFALVGILQGILFIISTLSLT